MLEGHENVVSAVTFSRDGKRVVSASWDRTARIWEAGSGRLLTTLDGHRDWVLDVSTTPEDKSLVSASQHAARVWSTTSFEQTAESPGLGGASVNTVGMSSDGQWLATGGRDGFVRLWKVGEPSPLREIGGFDSWVNRVTISPDSRRLAAGTRAGKILVFDLPSGDASVSFTAHQSRQVTALGFSPDGKSLASGGFDQTAILWDSATGDELAKLTGHQGAVTALAWSPDGGLLATGERHGSLHLWNLRQNNRLLAKITAHTDNKLGFSVTALAFSPDGKRIVSGAYDSLVKIWPVPDE